MDKLIRTVDDSIGTQRTNVIYLNTDCNLRCTYCYESDSKNGLPDQANCSEESIDDFLGEIMSREKNVNSSSIVLMGGEPFLRLDLIEYTINKAISLVEEGLHNAFSFCVIHNGTLLSDKNCLRFKKLVERGLKASIAITLEISYDGIPGQASRKFPSGKSSNKIVERGLSNLIKHNIKYRLSLTCHSGNVDTLIYDLIYIFEKYKKPLHRRITVGYAHSELDKSFGQNKSFEVKKELRTKLEYLFLKYNIPICGNVCHICKKCERSNYIGNSYLSPTTGVSYASKKIKQEFKQF